jgi:hypothetical protein
MGYQWFLGIDEKIRIRNLLLAKEYSRSDAGKPRRSNLDAAR